MDEEETIQETATEKPVENKDDGSKPKPVKAIDELNAATERLEKANAEKKVLLDREDDNIARRTLDGETEAGGTTEKKEETPKEYKDRILRGEVKDE